MGLDIDYGAPLNSGTSQVTLAEAEKIAADLRQKYRRATDRDATDAVVRLHKRVTELEAHIEELTISGLVMNDMIERQRKALAKLGYFECPA